MCICVFKECPSRDKMFHLVSRLLVRTDLNETSLVSQSNNNTNKYTYDK